MNGALGGVVGKSACMADFPTTLPTIFDPRWEGQSCGATLSLPPRMIQFEGERMIRVVHYGLGPIGAGIARVAVTRSDVEIVGAIDVDPAKIGLDIHDVIGLERRLGVTVSGDAMSVLQATRPDVVIHATGSHLAQVAPQLRQIVEAGAALVSTCEELSFPFEAAPELAAELDRLA